MSIKNKTFKKVLFIIGVLVTVVLITVMIIASVWKPKLTSKIKDEVYSASNHLYTIDFEDISLNLFLGSARLKNVTLKPDSALVKNLLAKNQSPKNVFDINVKELKINRVGIWKIVFDKKLTLKSIELNEPQILINQYTNGVKKQEKNSKSLYESVSKTFKSVNIGSVKLKQANFNLAKPELKTNTSLNHVNLNITDILLDSLSEKDTTRFFLSKNIAFEILKFKMQTQDKDYNLHIDTIRGDLKRKILEIKKLALTPVHNQLAYTRKFKVQKDWYDLNFNNIDFHEFDYYKLSSKNNFHAKTLIIGPADVSIFMSRESPPPASLDKGRNYPHVALKRLKLNLSLDTVKLNGINLKYAEYNPATKQSGTIMFKALNGHILNVTNDSVQLKKNNHAIAKLNTLLMGSSKLNLNIDFNLTSSNAAFSYSGNMINFNLKNLNPLSKALGLVEIESGQLQKLTFNVDGNYRTAKGNLALTYNNLKVKLLSDNIDGKGIKKKGFLSFLANKILIKSDNPSKDEPDRTAFVQNERINSASFFNLMWKTLFVGIKEIIGVGIVPEKDPVKQQKIIAEKIKAEKKKNN